MYKIEVHPLSGLHSYFALSVRPFKLNEFTPLPASRGCFQVGKGPRGPPTPCSLMSWRSLHKSCLPVRSGLLSSDVHTDTTQLFSTLLHTVPTPSTLTGKPCSQDHIRRFGREGVVLAAHTKCSHTNLSPFLRKTKAFSGSQQCADSYKVASTPRPQTLNVLNAPRV